MTNIHAEVVASKKWMLKRGGWRGRPGGGETTAPLEVREYRRQPRGSVASVGSRPATAPSEPRTSPSRGRPTPTPPFTPPPAAGRQQLNLGFEDAAPPTTPRAPTDAVRSQRMGSAKRRTVLPDGTRLKPGEERPAEKPKMTGALGLFLRPGNFENDAGPQRRSRKRKKKRKKRHYVCLAKPGAIVRAGKEMDSEVRGQIYTDEVVASRAEAVNSEGIRRVRIEERGWVSMVASDGQPVLKLVSRDQLPRKPSPPKPAAEPEAADDTGGAGPHSPQEVRPSSARWRTTGTRMFDPPPQRPHTARETAQLASGGIYPSMPTGSLGETSAAMAAKSRALRAEPVPIPGREQPVSSQQRIGGAWAGRVIATKNWQLALQNRKHINKVTGEATGVRQPIGMGVGDVEAQEKAAKGSIAMFNANTAHKKDSNMLWIRKSEASGPPAELGKAAVGGRVGINFRDTAWQSISLFGQKVEDIHEEAEEASREEQMQTARALLQRQMEEEGQRVTWVRGQVRRPPAQPQPAHALVRKHGSCAHFGCATHSGVVDGWSAAVRQLSRRSTAEGQRRPLAPPALARPLMCLPCPASRSACASRGGGGGGREGGGAGCISGLVGGQTEMLDVCRGRECAPAGSVTHQNKRACLPISTRMSPRGQAHQSLAQGRQPRRALLQLKQPTPLLPWRLLLLVMALQSPPRSVCFRLFLVLCLIRRGWAHGDVLGVPRGVRQIPTLYGQRIEIIIRMIAGICWGEFSEHESSCGLRCRAEAAGATPRGNRHVQGR